MDVTFGATVFIEGFGLGTVRDLQMAGDQKMWVVVSSSGQSRLVPDGASWLRGPIEPARAKGALELLEVAVDTDEPSGWNRRYNRLHGEVLGWYASGGERVTVTTTPEGLAKAARQLTDLLASGTLSHGERALLVEAKRRLAQECAAALGRPEEELHQDVEARLARPAR